MPGVCLVVAYDGSAFAGWQSQPGERTVQATLEKAVATLSGVEGRVFGASRTDSGVHAYGQVAAFDSPREIALHGWQRGLNGRLPEDISIQSATVCAEGYNPRYDALAKTYRYLLHLGPARDPLLRGRAWHLGPRLARPLGGRPTRPEDWLNIPAMREAAAELIGEHDFRAFKSSRDPRKSTVRKLTRVDIAHWRGRTDLLAIEVRGNAFLHNMVRIIAGTLVDVGRERATAADVAAVLRPQGARDEAGQTAPPHGLYLVEVELGRES